jgi:hypothetical protein
MIRYNLPPPELLLQQPGIQHGSELSKGFFPAILCSFSPSLFDLQVM